MKIFAALLQFTLAQHLRWFTKCPEPAQMDSFDVPAVSSYFFNSIKPKFLWLIYIKARFFNLPDFVRSWSQFHQTSSQTFRAEQAHLTVALCFVFLKGVIHEDVFRSFGHKMKSLLK